MVVAMTALLAVMMAAPTADVKGKWDGKLTRQSDDGTTREDVVLLILEQKDTTVTGTAGGNESDQHPITSGTIEGNKVTIAATTANGREYLLELTLENDELKGTVKSGDREGKLQAKKRKE